MPGAEIVASGLEDLTSGRTTTASLLVEMAAPRLRSLGLVVPRSGHPDPAGHRLYALLVETEPSPHSAYNALIRRTVSFLNAMEHAAAEPAGPRARIEAFAAEDG